MENLTSTQCDYSFLSQRRTVYAKEGMVTTTQPLAAQAGLEILHRGGNAVDAAIATAICLTVLEPVSNGVGGDAFALVWMKNKLYGLNGSGKAPSSISIEKLQERGLTCMPKRGPIPVMVPGAPAAWIALSRRFGQLPFEDLVAPAVCYAREGYPVSPAIRKYWNKSIHHAYHEFTGPEYSEWFNVFAPQGELLKPSQIIKFPDLANTLELMGKTECRCFYHGEIAEKIGAFVQQYGGYLSADDMAAYEILWDTPISINYRGYDVWEMPPNCQGLVALETLNILKESNFNTQAGVDAYHTLFEAIKMAFDDGLANISDPNVSKLDTAKFLAAKYGASLAGKIRKDGVYQPERMPLTGGTVYMAAADNEGNMVSFIQSNFEDFGSGLVVPGTGINLQNRGCSFQLQAEKSNALAPGKRSYHTIIPGFLSRDGQAIGPFGVMGSFMQPQGHVQVITNTLDRGMDPQSALDAPRWQWMGGLKFKVEPGIPADIVEGLRRRGHQIEVCDDLYSFGRGQIIWRDIESGVLAGGTDSRSDGVVAAW